MNGKFSVTFHETRKSDLFSIIVSARGAVISIIGAVKSTISIIVSLNNSDVFIARVTVILYIPSDKLVNSQE